MSLWVQDLGLWTLIVEAAKGALLTAGLQEASERFRKASEWDPHPMKSPGCLTNLADTTRIDSEDLHQYKCCPNSPHPAC